jgi:hypothetical protein
VSVGIGALSQDVPMYLVAAVFLGLFFAMQSGTVESIVYDTVLEETGDSNAFEATIGRLRLVESGALVARGASRRMRRVPCRPRAMAGVPELARRLTAADVADLDPYVRERFLATLVAPRRR